MQDRNNEFYLHGKAAVNFTNLGIIKFELLRHFPKTMRLLGVKFLPKETDRFFRNLIENVLKTRKEKGIFRPDMIQLLMEIMELDNSIKVTINDIVGQAFFFFLAGFDTTSGLICFIVHELAINFHIQKKLRQEIDKQIETDGGEINYDSLSKMKYLDTVINESLRMYPPAPTTNRVCIKDYNFPKPMEGFPNYFMTKGTILMISLYGLHRDPKYFPEPDKFDPDRFNDQNKSKIHPNTYLPFGIGPRKCIGIRLALMETKIIIVDILRNFIIKFTEKSENPITFSKTSFSITAQNGFWLKFEERKKKN
jgi:cytochrome P450 family 9